MIVDVSGFDLATVVVHRRPEDPPELVARVDRIRKALGFVPHQDLHAIVESASGHGLPEHGVWDLEFMTRAQAVYGSSPVLGAVRTIGAYSGAPDATRGDR